MKNRTEIYQNSVCILAFFLGAITFILIYGIEILNPTYIEWLYNGRDLMQHYLGWEFFRKADWYFPFGLTDQLGYPTLTSVIFTDSIPVFAVFFKLLSSVLPQNFQFFGLFGILCFALQGYFAAKIMRLYIKEEWKILIGSLFFVISPAMIFRMYMHTALAAHWLLLASIYICVKHDKEYSKIGKATVQWGLIGFLIAGIHLYFAPMCAAMLAGYVIYSCICDKKICGRHFIPVVGFAIGLFGNTFLLGGFHAEISSGTSNLGTHSFNLNSFFNPMGYSGIFPALRQYTNGQYEGFSYLGLGIIVLAAIACIYRIVFAGKQKRKEDYCKAGLMAAVFMVLTILAASHNISFGDKLLLTLPDIDIVMKYWGLFGSSGRLIWPVYYAIMFFAIVTISRTDEVRSLATRRVFNALLCVCILLQLYDVSAKYSGIHRQYTTKTEYESNLSDDIWSKIAPDDYQHLVWVSHNTDGYQILYMAEFALRNQMSMNNYYFARGIDFREYTRKDMQNINEDTLYIFKPEDTWEYEDYTLYSEMLFFYEANGYIIGSMKPIE